MPSQRWSTQFNSAERLYKQAHLSEGRSHQSGGRAEEDPRVLGAIPTLFLVWRKPTACGWNQRSHSAHGGLDLRVIFVCSPRALPWRVHCTPWLSGDLAAKARHSALLYPTLRPFGLAGRGCSRTDVRTVSISRALLPVLVKKGLHSEVQISNRLNTYLNSTMYAKVHFLH